MARKTTRTRSRRPGSVTSYETKSGIRWRWVPADPEFPEGDWKHVGKGGFETAEDADKAMSDARVNHRAGVDLTAAMPTVAGYARRWLDGLDLDVSNESSHTAGQGGFLRRLLATVVRQLVCANGRAPVGVTGAASAYRG